MGRKIVSVDATNKAEAIAALELLSETIKNTNYEDGRVLECVEVVNEGSMKYD